MVSVRITNEERNLLTNHKSRGYIINEKFRESSNPIFHFFLLIFALIHGWRGAQVESFDQRRSVVQIKSKFDSVLRTIDEGDHGKILGSILHYSPFYSGTSNVGSLVQQGQEEVKAAFQGLAAQTESVAGLLFSALLQRAGGHVFEDQKLGRTNSPLDAVFDNPKSAVKGGEDPVTAAIAHLLQTEGKAGEFFEFEPIDLGNAFSTWIASKAPTEKEDLAVLQGQIRAFKASLRAKEMELMKLGRHSIMKIWNEQVKAHSPPGEKELARKLVHTAYFDSDLSKAVSKLYKARQGKKAVEIIAGSKEVQKEVVAFRAQMEERANKLDDRTEWDKQVEALLKKRVRPLTQEDVSTFALDLYSRSGMALIAPKAKEALAKGWLGRLEQLAIDLKVASDSFHQQVEKVAEELDSESAKNFRAAAKEWHATALDAEPFKKVALALEEKLESAEKRAKEAEQAFNKLKHLSTSNDPKAVEKEISTLELERSSIESQIDIEARYVLSATRVLQSNHFKQLRKMADGTTLMAATFQKRLETEEASIKKRIESGRKTIAALREKLSKAASTQDLRKLDAARRALLDQNEQVERLLLDVDSVQTYLDTLDSMN